MIEREGGEAPQVCSHTAYGLKDFATQNCDRVDIPQNTYYSEYGLIFKVPYTGS